MRTPDNPPFICEVELCLGYINVFFLVFLNILFCYELSELWGGATSISDGIFLGDIQGEKGAIEILVYFQSDEQ